MINANTTQALAFDATTANTIFQIESILNKALVMGKLAEIKTKENSLNVTDFINGLKDEQKRKDSFSFNQANAKDNERKT